LSVVENPNFQIPITVNPYDSLFGYATRGILDLSNAALSYSTTPLYTLKIDYQISGI